MYFFKSNQIIKRSDLKRTDNLCIVKNREESKIGKKVAGIDRKYVKEGVWRATPQKLQNVKESKLPKGLSAMVPYVKKT